MSTGRDELAAAACGGSPRLVSLLVGSSTLRARHSCGSFAICEEAAASMPWAAATSFGRCSGEFVVRA